MKIAPRLTTLLSLTTALCGCIRTRSEAQPESGGRQGGRRERGPATVQVQSVARKVVPRSLETTVNLTGRAQVDVFARVSGKVSFTGPREGDRVKSGQILFKVDRTDPGENFLATPVESPIAGWVGQWRVTLGTQVSPQDAVVLIVDDEVLRADVFLPVSEWSLVSKDTSVKVVANGQDRTARITTISRAADPVSGRGSFEIEIPNRDRSWKAGMVGTAKLEIDPRPRLLVPAQALSITDQGTFVYTAQDGVAHRKKITYELVNNDTVEVLTGLADVEQIITAGTNGLTDNTPIKLAGAESAPTQGGEGRKREGGERRRGERGGGGEGRPPERGGTPGEKKP